MLKRFYDDVKKTEDAVGADQMKHYAPTGYVALGLIVVGSYTVLKNAVKLTLAIKNR